MCYEESCSRGKNKVMELVNKVLLKEMASEQSHMDI